MQWPRILLFAATSVFWGQEPIRVDVTRIPVDAIVTKRGGEHVKSLGADDFLVLVDGKPARNLEVSYVEATSPSPVSLTQHAVRVQREQVRRTIAILIDDVKMGMESVHRTKLSLHQFVDKQMEAGDLVAILTTSGGIGALQQFTPDRRMLHRAIDRIRFQLTSAAANTDATGGEIGLLLQRRFAMGPMAAVRYVSRGMGNMPGRKSLILISDGVPISRSQDLKDPNITVSEARQVTESANRSAVTLYAIDARGLLTPPLQADLNVQGLDDEQVRELLDTKRAVFTDNQKGLNFLALETGGLTRFDSNDIGDSLGQILNDQAGYYLLTFAPEKGSAQFSRIEIRLKQAGLKIRYRKSVANRPDAGSQSKLFDALSAPFTSNGIELRLTPIARLEKPGVWQLGAILHIACEHLDHSEALRLKIVSITEGESITPDAMTEKSYLVEPRKEGLLYSLQSGVRKPGAYQVRVAVMDEKSGAIGATSAFVELPDLARSRPALSTITMQSSDVTSPATRTFARDEPITYSLTLYNRTSAAYSYEARIWSESQELWRGKTTAMTSNREVGATLNLGSKSVPGEYVLEVIAKPLTGNQPVLRQWIDFRLK